MKVKFTNSVICQGSSYVDGDVVEVDNKMAEDVINAGLAERFIPEEERLVLLLKKFNAGMLITPGETPPELIDLCASFNVPTQPRRERKSPKKAPKPEPAKAEGE